MIDCIIPARTGSTRFPSKIFAEVNGKAVLNHCIDNAKQCTDLKNVWVAADEYDDIWAPNLIKTKKIHNTCTSRVAEAVIQTDADYFVNLQSDEPCVTADMISGVIRKMLELQEGMVQCCYPLTDEERSNINVVKAVISNGKIVYLTRTPDRELMDSPNLVGINGLYAYDLGTIMNYPEYDLNLVNAHKGLDTLAFIGKVDVIPYMIDERTPAVDVPDDIKLVEEYLDRS